MKITLVIEDAVMRRLEERAAREGCSMSELVETVLRRMLDEQPTERDLPPLTVMRATELVDIADRDALYRAMDER